MAFAKAKLAHGMVAGVLALLPLASVSATPPDAIVGDVNLDGIVDQDDLDAILYSDHYGNSNAADYCSSGHYITILDGDVNRDGAVNYADYLLAYLNWLEELDPIPEIEGVGIVTSYNTSTKKLLVQDIHYDENTVPITIMSDSGTRQLWYTAAGHTCLEPQFAVSSRDDGFDLLVTYDNSEGMTAKCLGTLFVPNMLFGTTIHRRAFLVLEDSRESQMTIPQCQECVGNFSPGTREYPDAIFSPATVIRGTVAHEELSTPMPTEYTVGVSLHYPVLKYRHVVAMGVGAFAYQWATYIEMNDPNAAYHNPDADIQPGEVRTYTIAVRFMRTGTWEGVHENDWLHVLQPYRRYFRGLYGTVQFERDPRPMAAMNVAGNDTCHETDNPYNFNFGPSMRPDLITGDGWEGWVSEMEDLAGDGFERFMLRKPSGYFCPDSCGEVLNFPFQFTSNWWAIADGDPHPIVDTLDLIEDFVESVAGREIGLWWGRAVEVMDTWPACSATLLDPCDTGLVSAAFDELDGAEVPGANMIGLDAFNLIPAWERHYWLQVMQSAYPSMRFTQESRPSDLLAILSPLWVKVSDINGHRAESDALMDMLIPGHEAHGGILFEMGQFSPSHYANRMQAMAELGFVPQIFFDDVGDMTSDPEAFYAAESWLDSVPSAILNAP